MENGTSTMPGLDMPGHDLDDIHKNDERLALLLEALEKLNVEILALLREKSGFLLKN